MYLLTDRDFCAALVLSLGHFLWQGLVIAALAAVVVRRLKTANGRYVGLVAAFGLMAASPIFTLAVVAVRAERPAPPVVPAPKIVVAEPVVDVPPATVPTAENPADVEPMPRPIAADVPPPNVTPPAASEEAVETPAPASESSWQRFAPLMTDVYLFGVMSMLLRLAVGLWGGWQLRRRSIPVTDAALLQALQRQAASLGMKFVPMLAYCERVAVPTVIGILKPTILLPLALTSGLAPEQVEAVLAHELAHLRRYDHLVNLLQRVIESLLFFHPAVWWLSHQIRVEREHCCDDLVVARGAVPLDYAKSLLRVAELSRGAKRHRSVSAVSLLATGQPSTLRQRIARLLGDPLDSHVRFRNRWPVVVLCLTCVMLASLVFRIALQPAAEGPTPRPDSYIAKLPDGVSVEFVGLAANEPNPTQWWRPDGAPMEPPEPIPPALGTYRVTNAQGVAAELRSAVLQVRGVKADYQAVTANMGGTKQIQHLPSGEPFIVYSGTLERPPSKTGAVVRIGVATEPISPVRILEANGKRRPRPASAQVDHIAEDITVTKILQLGGGKRLVDGKYVAIPQLELEYQIPTAWRQPDLRIVAIDKTGKSHDTSGSGGGFPTNATHLSPGSVTAWVYFPLSLEQIDRFEYQFRLYRHWVTFENVAYDAGDMTNLVVSTDSLPPPKPEHYVASLPNGVTVGLVGVGLHPSEKGEWWKADGSLLAERPNTFLDENFSNGFPNQADCREIALEFIGLPKDHFVTARVGRGVSGVAHSAVENGVKAYNIASGPFTGEESTSVEVSLVLEPLGPAQGIDADGRKLADVDVPLELKPFYDRVQPIRVESHDGQLDLLLKPLGDLLLKADWRLHAIDADGQTIQPSTSSANGEGSTWGFKLARERLARFEYRLRPYRHRVNFENVSLHPGKQTEVKISTKSLPSEKIEAKLPNGIKIELAGVSTPPLELPSNDKRTWWKGDGSPLDQSPFPLGFLTVGPDKAVGREFAIRVTAPAEKPSLTMLSPAGEGTWSNSILRWTDTTPEGNVADWENVVGPLDKAVTATLKIGVASDPWTVIRFDPEGKQTNDPPMDDALKSLRDSIKGVRAGPFEDGVAFWTQPVSSNSERGVIELIALDKSGKPHFPNGGSSDGKEQCFPFKIPPDELDHFEFRLRPYRHWVTFQDVSLEPGKQSDVKVSVSQTTDGSSPPTVSAPADNTNTGNAKPPPVAPEEKPKSPQAEPSPGGPSTTLTKPTDEQLQAATKAFEDLGGCRESWSRPGNEHIFRLTRGSNRYQPYVTDEVVPKIPNLPFAFGLNLGATEITAKGLRELAKLDNLVGLYLVRSQVTDEGLKELARFKNLVILQIWESQVTEAGLKELANLQSVRVLTLSGSAFGDVWVKEAAKIEHLTSLHLSNGVSDAGMQAIGQMQNLKKLAFFQGQISDAGWEELARLRNLSELHLPIDLKLTDTNLKQLARLENLTTLSLQSSTITDDGLKEIAGLGKLTCLDLSHTSISDAGLKHVVGFDKLEDLRLHSTKVTDAGLKELARLTNLKRLYLGHTRISDEGLSELVGLKNLTALDLISTLMTDRGLEHVAQLPNVERLDLRFTGITGAGLKELSKLDHLSSLLIAASTLSRRSKPKLQNISGLQNLKSLNVWDFETSEAAMKEVASLQHLTHLGVHGKITDAELQALSGSTSIQNLDVNSRLVTDAGLKSLANLRTLTELRVGNGKFTLAGRAILQAALPRCDVDVSNIKDGGTGHQQPGIDEILEAYPKLKGFSLDMTEPQFLEFAKRQELKTRKSVVDGKVRYRTGIGFQQTLVVIFDKEGKCTGIEHIRGQDFDVPETPKRPGLPGEPQGFDVPNPEPG
jgi:beta-lactamase regulating signal transducer with metallopeptidase domain/Leucine-rich repeat (LRR) protein